MDFQKLILVLTLIFSYLCPSSLENRHETEVEVYILIKLLNIKVYNLNEIFTENEYKTY